MIELLYEVYRMSCLLASPLMKKNKQNIIIELKVVPQSGRSELTIDKKGNLKAYLKSAPERGLANDEVIRLIATALKVPKTDIQIIYGLTNRLKRIKIISFLTKNEIYEQLGIPTIAQLSVFEKGER